MNGFTWDGDAGTGPDQTGTPKGTLYIDGGRVSPAYTGAEAILGFQPTDRSYGTYALLFDKPAGTTPSFGSYNYNTVPSTTSIIKNGACSRSPTDAETDSWSAVGEGTGILLLASSVSGTSTTAYELCTIFEAMDIMDGAVRVDGGPSAAIFWLGSHLNPLTGARSLYYGSARHIPYAVGAIH